MMERLSNFKNDKVVVRFDRREVVMLANALNEAREALDDFEFATRMGVQPEEAERLRQAIKALLSSSAG